MLIKIKSKIVLQVFIIVLSLKISKKLDLILLNARKFSILITVFISNLDKNTI